MSSDLPPTDGPSDHGNDTQERPETPIGPDRPTTPGCSGMRPPGDDTVEDTPYRIRLSQTTQYQNGTLDEKRRLAMEDVGYTIPEVEVEAFVKHLLPPLKSNIDIATIMSSSTFKELVNNENHWRQFEIRPALYKAKEDKTFEPLAEIFNTVTDLASGNGAQQTLAMRLLPNRAPHSERASTTRPDAIFVLKDVDAIAERKRDQHRWWYDVAVSAEFKKGRSFDDRDDNVKKLVFNMQHVMALDPRRRFTFGISIENNDMRLWLCSRSIVIVSMAFDFTQNSELLTHIFLSLAFASYEELGWDVTVNTIINKDKKRAYIFDVDGQKYETVQVLSDYAADSLVGRATRVYQVRKLGTDEYYVLKDIWLDDDRQLEHEIYGAILADISRTFGEDAKKTAAEHLLTPVAHCLVKVNEQVDHTTKVIMRGFHPPFDSEFKLIVKDVIPNDEQKAVGPPLASDMEFEGDKRRLMTPLPRFPLRTKLHHRVHYRIVFRELGRPIYTLRKLLHMIIALKDCASVLELIHGSGWVHRDISVGNLYLFDGRGLLGDLEYAKRTDNSDATHEVRTGTPDFMAVEAVDRVYNYRSVDLLVDREQSASTVTRVLQALHASTEGRASAEERKNVKDTPPAPKFSHNALHDLESLWWIFVWILFFFRDESQSEMSKADTDARIKATQVLFPKTLDTKGRAQFLEKADIFSEKTKWFPHSFAVFIKVLNALRLVLYAGYKSFEVAFDREALKGAHGDFRDCFDACTKIAGNVVVASYKTTGIQQQKLGGADENLGGPGPTNAPGPASAKSSVLGKRKAIDDLEMMPRPDVRRNIAVEMRLFIKYDPPVEGPVSMLDQISVE